MKKVSKARPAKRSNRLTADRWLEDSMKLLAKRGPPALTLESLTRHFKVTTGSFYWHFKSHGAFLNRLADKYIEEYTVVVAKHLASLDAPPRQVLIEASRMIMSSELSRYDIHFRSLALTYPKLAPKIAAMDEYRTQIITNLFRDLGFRGDELRMRSHAFLVLHSMELSMKTCIPAKERLSLLDERIRLLAD